MDNLNGVVTTIKLRVQLTQRSCLALVVVLKTVYLMITALSCFKSVWMTDLART